MATTTELLGKVNDEKLAQRTALTAKGVDMTDVPFIQYHEKIAGIPGGNGATPQPSKDDYVRPSDRLPVPKRNANEIYVLFGSGEDAPNDYAIAITCVGGYKVDWGDGKTDNWASAAVAQHQYDYATLAVQPDSRGYKQTWVKITPATGNPLQQIDLHVRPSTRAAASSANIFIPQALEIYINAPSLTSITWGNQMNPNTRYRMLEIFDYEGAVLKNASYFLTHCSSLRVFTGANLIDATSYFMWYCSSYNQPFPEGVTFSNVTVSFMNSCFSYNQPFPEGVTFSNVTVSFMNSCSSYNQPFPEGVTFSNVTNSFMNSCFSYNQPFPEGVMFSKATTYFMYSCTSYNQPFPAGVTFSNVTTSFMSYCNSYNQPFPAGVMFSKATDGFMNGCSAYNQPFPAGVTFSNVTYNFMNNCYSFNHSVTIYLQNTTAIGTLSPGGNNFAQKGLRLLNMGAVHTAIDVSNSSMGRNALVALFGDLYDRSATTKGTITVTNCAGASSVTSADLLIATKKNWTVVGVMIPM